MSAEAQEAFHEAAASAANKLASERSIRNRPTGMRSDDDSETCGHLAGRSA